MTRSKFPYRRQSHGQAHETVVLELTMELQQMWERPDAKSVGLIRLPPGFLTSVPEKHPSSAACREGKPALLVLRGGLRSDRLRPQQNSGIAQ